MKAVFHDLLPAIAEREAADALAFPRQSIDDLMAARVHAGPFPSHLGGLDWSLVDAVDAVMDIASASPSCALVLSMPIGLAGGLGVDDGIVPVGHRDSWEEARHGIAADYRAGRIYAACNSEKGAGGSLANTKTSARRAEDGTFRVSGEKILASSGRYAHRFFSTAKVSQDDLPGAGVVEFFLVDPAAEGVTVMEDWNGFGMRSTESHTVRYDDAPSDAILGFPGYIDTIHPLQYWFCLFAAIPVGCARAILTELGTPAPQSPALRLRLSEAQMRLESLEAYLRDTASRWHGADGPEFAARVMRTKTFVAEEATALCARLFALGGGRHYRQDSAVARAMADAFAGVSLRPPLTLALDTLCEQFTLEPNDPAAGQ